MSQSEQHKIGVGFSETESERIQSFLQKFFMHVDSTAVIIVGGLAIRLAAFQAGKEYSPRPFNDIDFINTSGNDVIDDLTGSFKISHYHPNGYLAVVDPDSHLKADIFNNDFSIEETVEVKVGNVLVRVASPEEQLVKTVFDLQRISGGNLVAPKQFEDAELLLGIVGSEEAQRIWEKKAALLQHENVQFTRLQEALDYAKNIKDQHPELLTLKPFEKPDDYVCPECPSADPRIAPRREILQILRRR